MRGRLSEDRDRRRKTPMTEIYHRHARPADAGDRYTGGPARRAERPFPEKSRARPDTARPPALTGTHRAARLPAGDDGLVLALEQPPDRLFPRL